MGGAGQDPIGRTMEDLGLCCVGLDGIARAVCSGLGALSVEAWDPDEVRTGASSPEDRVMRSDELKCMGLTSQMSGICMLDQC